VETTSISSRRNFRVHLRRQAFLGVSLPARRRRPAFGRSRAVSAYERLAAKGSEGDVVRISLT